MTILAPSPTYCLKNTSDPSPVNHTITINDPANNNPPSPGGMHDPFGEYASHMVTVNPNDLSISLNGGNARIYGAVVTSAIPEPSCIAACFLLLGFGLFRRRQIKQKRKF